MNEKIIYIRPDEEITSVIDRLVKAKKRDVFLVIPISAVITQSLVNLKLLKREADNLRKQVTIISQDPTAIRLAKKADFQASESLDELAGVEDETEEEEKEKKDEEYASETNEEGQDEESEEEEDNETVMEEQLTENEFAGLLKEERKRIPARMSDIVRGVRPASGKFVAGKNSIFGRAAKFLHKQRESEETSEEQPRVKKAEMAREDYSNYMWRHKGRAKSEDMQEGRGIGRLLPGRLMEALPLKIFGIFIGAAIVIAGLVFLLMLPSAEITIAAKRDNATIDLKITADKNVGQADVAANKIPGQIVKLEEKETAEFSASGQRQLNDKAKGVITVFNAYSSEPQTLVETTRFLSPQGKIYRLTKTVTIPGAKVQDAKIIASSLDVNVEADQPGVDYNIGSADFTIPGFKGSPKYTGFYGKSQNAMTGGSTENVRVMTQEDFDKAKEKVWGLLKQKAEKELTDQIPNGYKLVSGALATQMGEVKPSVEVGGKAEKFTLTIKATARALIFLEEDIWRLIQNDLADILSDTKEIQKRTQVEYKDIKVDMEKGQLSFKVQGSQEVVWKVDTEEIKKITAGKKEQEIKDVLFGRPEIKEARFSLWPFWSSKIPKQLDKIRVTVDPSHGEN
ncbi:MAG: hypothetical protein V1845_02790 [bacterium]